MNSLNLPIFCYKDVWIPLKVRLISQKPYQTLDFVIFWLYLSHHRCCHPSFVHDTKCRILYAALDCHCSRQGQQLQQFLRLSSHTELIHENMHLTWRDVHWVYLYSVSLLGDLWLPNAHHHEGKGIGEGIWCRVSHIFSVLFELLVTHDIICSK